MVIVDIRPPEVNGGPALESPLFTILETWGTINPELRSSTLRVEPPARLGESSYESVRLFHRPRFHFVLRFQLERLPDVRAGQRLDVQHLLALLEHPHRCR